MKIKNILILLSTLVLTIIFASHAALSDDDRKEKLIQNTITQILEEAHYAPQEINDNFSKNVYKLYIENLDYNKMYFTNEQVSVLKTYEVQIDDEIKSQTLNFFKLSLELINQQLKFIEDNYPSILEKPFDYTKEETIEIDAEKRTFVANNTELLDFWRKYLKYQVVDEIVIEGDNQIEAKKLNDTVVLKSFEELEKDARDKILKRYNSRFKRINKINEADRFSAYINSITGAFDPHTSYFPPKDKKDFDIHMSGKLEGIGATLSEKDGFTKVVSIVPGSPSWKQGELKSGDIILKVAQGDAEPVDIVDMRLDESVQLIRGKKGSKVVLTVKKVKGEIVKIPIIRDVVELEEQYAKSAILYDSIHNNTKVGYIYLPQFYGDMQSNDGRRCGEDIKQEVIKLKNENVSGIIIDLRNNGGGLLNEVVKIGGYFIEKGPIVQVRDYANRKNVHKDYNPSIEYDGDLIIMVNYFSASASEILAAAMQDYKRAVIVGAGSTYGKGTVQTFADLDRTPGNDDVKPLGHVKLTIQKYYRINGGSTQLKGVIPDIILPDMYQNLELGEKELDFPLEWTEIPSEEYKVWDKKIDYKKLQKNSQERTANDSAFILISESANWLKDKKDNTLISLSYTNYKEQKEAENKIAEKYKNVGKANSDIRTIKFGDNLTIPASDTLKIQKLNEWHNTLQKDIELSETYKIMLDMLNK